MDVLGKLTALGAYSCAGDLILGGKVLARLRNGVADLTDDGRRLLNQDAEDAVVKEVRPAARRQRAQKAAAVEVEVASSPSPVLAKTEASAQQGDESIDDILNGTWQAE